MSGHSKWASIKHKKAAQDAKRGKIFTKLIKELTVATRAAGSNPDNNPRLRLAISLAKEANMPAENIERAIKRGTGELPGVSYEEVSYEGYGPQGVAMYIQCLTDNKKRTASEIRNIFERNGGNMSGAGSVAWQFDKKGLFVVEVGSIAEDKLLDIVTNAQAEDLSRESKVFEIICDAKDFENIRQALVENKVKYKSADITMLPKNLIKIEAEEAKKALGLIEALEEHDDVQNVYTNFDIPEELMEVAG